MDIDFDGLRNAIEDSLGTAMFGGFPMAAADMAKLNSMSDDDLVSYAKRLGINVSKYTR